ncbi:MAG: pyrroline-5-carboxylate reductase [Desulfopila sp.]|jgi:pyrroline-5-carboxylate reductase|nr:pyrroline-5-carboxylate reductase [Desulfopila sp.]
MKNKIGFIGGGQMAEALIKGMLAAELYKSDDIYLVEPNSIRREHMESRYSLHCSDSHEQFWEKCDIVLIAVKPQIMAVVLEAAKPFISNKHIIITIAAGLPINFYERSLGSNGFKIIRVMPNTPALILEGTSAICCNSNVTDKEMEIAESIFNAVGISVLLDEVYLDAATGLSGSGPAYVFSFIEALIDAGIKVGLTRYTAETMAVQTVLGAAKLMQKEKKHPAVLRSMVTSPGGTSIAAHHFLEKKGFGGIVMDAVEIAVNRSKELGKQ